MIKKSIVLIFSITILGLLIILSSSCKKNKDDSNTPMSGKVTDIDGNIYTTVTICSKVWMVENLKTTKFNDGQVIPLVTDSLVWSKLTSQGCCWYKNDINTNKQTYGALYNWYTVNSRKLAPKGWHVPSIIEWDQMLSCIGDSASGDKLKETGTIHWQSPNAGATNEYGFTALPAGARSDGYFSGLGTITYFWSSSGNLPVNAWYVMLLSNYESTNLSICPLQSGFSVRCVKD
ncbi:MAG: fibrobacter succinogenes major paralogous domain-containing protein [Bacteroidetes bacterium]|nr:fibrobacter succinogenes major paralogous domain-containing protein [Bacteroidota bacterium]